jgi:putative DNA-invertase from lambdoid prophage Rac
MARLGDGDRLVVWKVDRLGRSTLDALNTAKDLDARGVAIVITTLGIDLKTAGGRLVFGLMAQIAEFERELIRDRILAGIAAAKGRGVHMGRRHTLKPNQRVEAARLHLQEGKSIGSIAALFGGGRTVVFRAIQAQQQAQALLPAHGYPPRPANDANDPHRHLYPPPEAGAKEEGPGRGDRRPCDRHSQEQANPSAGCC